MINQPSDFDSYLQSERETQINEMIKLAMLGDATSCERCRSLLKNNNRPYNDPLDEEEAVMVRQILLEGLYKPAASISSVSEIVNVRSAMNDVEWLNSIKQDRTTTDTAPTVEPRKDATNAEKEHHAHPPTSL